MSVGGMLSRARHVVAGGVGLFVTAALLVLPAPAEAQEVIEYYGADHLGSIRVVFDATGNVVSRADYLPFGEEMSAPGPMPAEHFTGQARDGEAGFDYFNARQYQPRTGRFNAVDPVFVGPMDPQQWNRYRYARGNPLSFTDPTGKYNKPQTNCSQGNGAYWCPGDGSLFIPSPTFVNSDDPLDWGYHGGELGVAEVSYSAGEGQAPAAPMVAPAVEKATEALIAAARLLGVVVGSLALADAMRDLLENQPHLRHYTDIDGMAGIVASGMIRPSARGNVVYVTPDMYSTGADAQHFLELSRTPAGFFQIPVTYLPGLSGFGYGKTSHGGNEILIPYAIPARGLTWIPIPPR